MSRSIKCYVMYGRANQIELVRNRVLFSVAKFLFWLHFRIHQNLLYKEAFFYYLNWHGGNVKPFIPRIMMMVLQRNLTVMPWLLVLTGIHAKSPETWEKRSWSKDPRLLLLSKSWTITIWCLQGMFSLATHLIQPWHFLVLF